ncbi:MAG: NAD-dependent deacylase [Bacteroidales bacterium]|jgi:NAD-dependent deacetylase|nr:NAD-dependent deacylase [Bacteroidales bacterium]
MKKLIVLSGAGMSAESGISTFRDSNGLWEQHRVEDVATPEGFAKKPELVLDFYNQRRRQLLKCQPNAGHTGLVALEKDFEVHIITQNVDNLHERAGSTRVIHLHGELMKSCSVTDLCTPYDIPPEHPDINIGDKDTNGCQLRPFIVWFGEDVPMIKPAAKLIQQADIVVVIGTSLNVYPAAGLLDCVNSGCPIFLIDPNDVATYRRNIHFIRAGASKGVSILTDMLKKMK